jgi:hypothetical protein
MRSLRIALMGLTALALVGACAHSKKKSPGPYGEPPGAIPGAPMIPHRDLAQAAPDAQGTGQPSQGAPDSAIATPTPAPLVTSTPEDSRPIDDQTGVMAGTSAGQPSTSSSPRALPTATP